jgi:hypothetical protein
VPAGRGRGPRARQVPSAGGHRDELLEQGAVRTIGDECLGVPLHGEDERVRWILDRLDRAIGRARAHAQPGADPVHGLMMKRVHSELGGPEDA